MARLFIPENAPKPPKPVLKRSFFKSAWFPGMIAVGLFAVAGLYMAGLITLPHLGRGLTFNLDPVVSGQPISLNFAPALMPYIDPSGKGENGPYTFFLDSGVGFPPMGLILGPDGVLRGTPTGLGSDFRVCVKDGSGKSACRNYYLDVNPPSESTGETDGTSADSTASSCSTKNPGCGNGANPNMPAGPNNPIIDGTIVPSSCPCPDGTKFDADLGTTKHCACV